MAKGWSGSPRHTARTGMDGGGRAPAESGPRIGPGVMKSKVNAEVNRAKGGNGDPKIRNMKTYSQE